MSFQQIFNCIPCLRCITFNRTFNTFNLLQKNPLNQIKCLGRRNINDQSIFNLNTNVPKDVLLYKSPSDRTFKMIGIFSIVQFGFWVTAADAYNVLLNRKPNPNGQSNPDTWVDILKSKGKIVTLGVPIGCLCMGKLIVNNF